MFYEGARTHECNYRNIMKHPFYLQSIGFKPKLFLFVWFISKGAQRCAANQTQPLGPPCEDDLHKWYLRLMHSKYQARQWPWTTLKCFTPRGHQATGSLICMMSFSKTSMQKDGIAELWLEMLPTILFTCHWNRMEPNLPSSAPNTNTAH